ncbi:MAG: 16S rRNA (cytosine(1402)-N(4))-methyltransferase RsmH [Smithellaceae bacterium]|nr:16S rRNA (cytosine(1402)-N(4))-methyltransferase RsmH [Smithellaceae bacterium]
MMTGFAHEPVMREEVLSWLAGNKTGVYVDGTIGGGGHALAILENTRARLIGIDRDAEAILAARQRLEPFQSRVTLVKGNFADLASVLGGLDIEKVDGVILDLGVSSHQLDAAHRGFSFGQSAPLDMRMDRDETLRAYDIVNSFTPSELEKVIRLYGEEKMAARIARAIVRRRQASPIETTAELAQLIVQVMPQSMKHQKIHPATRTFQAIRIAVNRELEVIVPGIEAAVAALSAGGRLGVISFHSLEDRIVKHTFLDLAAACVCPKDIPYCICHKQAVVKVLTRKAVTPSPEEIRRNPRARSAKLRVAERL